MGKANDFFKTIKGEALEGYEEGKAKAQRKAEEGRAKREKKAQTSAAKTTTREPQSSQKALLEAYEYAGNEQLNKDVQAVLKGGPISKALRLTLQVMVDSDEYRELLLSQREVKKPEPKPGSYDLDPVYTDQKGEIVADEIIEAMIKSGKALEDLGVSAELYRVDKKTKEQIGPASDEEYAEYFKALYDKAA